MNNIYLLLQCALIAEPKKETRKCDRCRRDGAMTDIRKLPRFVDGRRPNLIGEEDHLSIFFFLAQKF